MTASPATEIDFEIHPSQTRVPAAERSGYWRTRGSARSSPIT